MGRHLNCVVNFGTELRCLGKLLQDDGFFQVFVKSEKVSPRFFSPRFFILTFAALGASAFAHADDNMLLNVGFEGGTLVYIGCFRARERGGDEGLARTRGGYLHKTSRNRGEIKFASGVAQDSPPEFLIVSDFAIPAVSFLSSV